MADVGRAALDVHRNAHSGKMGVLTLAPTEGLGVPSTAKREKHLEASPFGVTVERASR
jgi:crotonyl-CoA reductase